MKLLKRDRERMKLTLSEIQRLVSVGWTPGLVDKDRDGNVCSIDRCGLSVSPRYFSLNGAIARSTDNDPAWRNKVKEFLSQFQTLPTLSAWALAMPSQEDAKTLIHLAINSISI